VTEKRPKGGSPRILVVDDNDDNVYTLKLHLDLEGYIDVETARDGEEAIARLKTDSFDLVLLDVMMPKIDGFQVLIWLKDQARLRDLPVIMISALTELNSMARCIELGAVDYLLKPFNPVLLKARLGATLEKKRLRDEIDAHLARLQEELDAARRLQMAMVPQSFPAPSSDFPIDLCASMEPAREVGGDLYDFFLTEDGMLCFLVGDVSGKGMAAALFMARTKSLIRIATDLMRSRQGPSAAPAEIIARVNRELCQNNSDMMFVTLFFGMLRPTSGELEFCNAGHNAPYRLNGQEIAAIEGAKGVILGRWRGRAFRGSASGSGAARRRRMLDCRGNRKIGGRSGAQLRRHGAAFRRHHHAGGPPARFLGTVSRRDGSLASRGLSDRFRTIQICPMD
jgi:sigma-B regulation protein RsbU (phosphoserine phosphatase)